MAARTGQSGKKSKPAAPIKGARLARGGKRPSPRRKAAKAARRSRRRRPRARKPPKTPLPKAAALALLPAALAHVALHGNTQWQPLALALAGLCWTWSSQPSLSQRWEQTRGLLAAWLPGAFLPTTDSSFVKTLAKATDRLAAPLLEHLRRVALAEGSARRVAGREVFAIDGTKVAVPWTADNEARLGEGTLAGRKRRRGKPRRRQAKRRSANSKAHDAVRPQLLLTLLWHVASGLPWAWRKDPIGGSERAAALALLVLLPARALLVGDAGFTGYDFWNGVRKAGHDFVLRIGSNVRLLEGLGWRCEVRGRLAYLWPQEQQRRREPPLVVRLATFKTARTTVWLATSLLDANEISDAEIAALYRQRWGLEGWFRSLKQTFDKRKMLSKTAAHAECELEWSILALGLAQAHGVEALRAAGARPHELSEAAALTALRTTALQRDFGRCDLRRLRDRLAAARRDGYVRKKPKAGRHAHRQKTHLPPGAPQLVRATPAQRRAAQEIQAQLGVQ